MYFVLYESLYQISESCPGDFVTRDKDFNLLFFQGELVFS